MLDEDKELYEIINKLNKDLDDILIILEQPIKKKDNKKENIQLNLENEIPEFVKQKRDNCCC